MDERTCRRCGGTQPLTRFRKFGDRSDRRRNQCMDCDNRIYREKWAANHNGIRSKQLRRARKYLYGVDQATFDALLAYQGGVCAMCAGPEPARGWNVDHDHATGEARGLVCHRCNLLLGLGNDDVDLLVAAIRHLKNPPMRRLARKKAQ